MSMLGELRRMMQRPRTIAQVVSELEYTAAMDHIIDGVSDIRITDPLKVLTTLTPAQCTHLDTLLQHEFRRGVAEGRIRQKYNEQENEE